MANLEDSIFKQNVPGRWSSFEPKGIDVRCDEKDEEDAPFEAQDSSAAPLSEEEMLLEAARDLHMKDVPETIRRSILAERERKSKTGVKGVLADYKTAKKMEEAQRQAAEANRNAILLRIAQGAKRSLEEEADDDDDDDLNGHVVAPYKGQQQQKKHEEEEDEEDDLDDLLDSDNDDEFLREFRHKRLMELKAHTAQPTFGTVRDVDTSDFIEQVENEDSRVVVVVHVFEPAISSCVRINRFLEEIAATSMQNVKFLRMQASSNQIEVDRVALPILNIYKGGELVQALVAVANELGGEFFSKEDLLWLLESTITGDHIQKL